jgi:predicted nucleotidyltransferase component of viral defense system
MRADFVNEVAMVLSIERKDLIEKDLILHQILTDLSKDGFFASNFLFKGGTCLIKSYFGYRRFSEDVDFTWKNQTKFSRMSQKRIRVYLSKVIDKTGGVFEDIARRRGLDFKCDKRNPDYVEFGGGNKTCTLKIWYQSEVLNRRSFLKVQINFVESMCFSPKNGQLGGLLTGKHEELQALFPEEYGEYSKKIRFGIYDVREILSEKVRAILTREGIKARDFVDVFFICRQFGIKVERMEPCIVKKTNFALKLYSKYRRNLREKIDLLQSGRLFEWGEERTLLLSDINETDFYLFVEEFESFLRQVVRSLNFQL